MNADYRKEMREAILSACIPVHLALQLFIPAHLRLQFKPTGMGTIFITILTI